VAIRGRTRSVQTPPASVSTVATAVNEPLAYRCEKTTTLSFERPLEILPERTALPLTTTVLLDVARVSGGGPVEKLTSLPKVVPTLFVATRR